MKQTYLAHSANSSGQEHELKKHLLHTTLRAQSYVFEPALQKTVQLAALLHDFGKYLKAFQNYLREGGVRGSVPHARWGALLARGLKAQEVSFAIDGHHAGLPNYSTWAQEHTFASPQAKQQMLDLLAAFKDDTGLTETDLTALCQRISATERQQDVLTRFVFSCLTDADWLDTEEHFSPEITAQRERHALQVEAVIALVDAELSKLAANNTVLNTQRTQARYNALQKAHLPVGFFSLNLPTGYGKTLTSFRWALEHAQAHKLERIIIVLPYTNIIDQTATLLKTIIGQDRVLEHHASYIPLDAKEHANQHTLACENWDYPIIITSTVQFFETLFSNKPSKCRKFHNISNAVVILDEVQTLRKNLVLPTLDMLQDVQQGMNTSFVFCTATMPAFEHRPFFPGIAHMTELTEEAPHLFAQAQRVEFHFLEELRPTSLETLKAALQTQNASTLVIGNTKRLARELHAAASTWQGWNAVYHLSTGMCPHHRKKVIREISTAVQDASKKVLVFSTQLVEAGVDLDFPCIFRELAPLESIIQAAGRCNREGRLSEKGKVILFQLTESRYPDTFYKTQTQHVRTLISSNPRCFYEYATFHDYYKQILDLYVNSLPVTFEREQQNFATVADQYRVIESSTQSLFVWDYNNDSKKLYNTLCAKQHKSIPLSRDEFRAIQQYSVNVYETDLRKYKGSFETAYANILVWNGGYDKDTGLNVSPHNTDTLIL